MVQMRMAQPNAISVEWKQSLEVSRILPAMLIPVRVQLARALDARRLGKWFFNLYHREARVIQEARKNYDVHFSEISLKFFQKSSAHELKFHW